MLWMRVTDDGGAFQRALAEAKGQRKVKLDVICRCGSSTAVRLAVAEGMGIAVVSRRAATADMRAGRIGIVRIRGLKLKRNFWLITDGGRTLSPQAKAFCRALSKYGDPVKSRTRDRRASSSKLQ
mgnify:CR=1 FL=1